MSDLFKEFEHFLKLAKPLSEESDRGQIKAEIQVNAGFLSNIC